MICQGIDNSRPTECKHGDVRLVDGLKETEGRLEVCAYGYWTIVCDGHYQFFWWISYAVWDIFAAQLICKQLGMPTEG